jgi:riboflavin kinase/FMN adenylyltransferase
MQVVHGLPATINSRPSILTIGVFDGVHRGHQHLIGMIVQRANQLECQSVVLTFDPHPDLVLRPDQQRLYITTLEQRIEQIAECGVDLLIILPFTHETMAQSAEAFMQRVCHAIDLRELWAGADLAVGHRREGTMTRLGQIGQTLGYTVHAIETFTRHGEQVRSTRVRAALEAGDLLVVQDLLGRPFSLRGVVVEGDKRGRTIGFPTANLAISEQHILPANGVYVCTTTIAGQPYGAVTNIGVRPTFSGLARRVETYVLDFSGDLYGETLTVAFHQRLRAEQKFDGIAALVAQITNDVGSAREWLAKHHSEIDQEAQ